jgi:plastocyanin
MRKRFTPMIALAASAAFLASCGSGSSGPAETVPSDVTFTVKAVPTLKFDASDYGPVSAGEVKIGYINEDAVRHTLVIGKDGVKVPGFKLEVASKGKADSDTVTLEAGTYTLICDVPGHTNMRATLVVK